jgi:hypothetical protein
MLLLDDEDQLASTPSPDELAFMAAIGAEGVEAVERAILGCTRVRWLKVARVVHDALSSNGFTASDGVVAMHTRLIGVLVRRRALESQGDLRRPRWSEVRLPVAGGKP